MYILILRYFLRYFSHDSVKVLSKKIMKKSILNLGRHYAITSFSFKKTVSVVKEIVSLANELDKKPQSPVGVR